VELAIVEHLLSNLAISPCSYPKSIITYTPRISKDTMEIKVDRSATYRTSGDRDGSVQRGT
jgi:hypothetical protein